MDEVAISAANSVAVLSVLPAPVELPAGGKLTALSQNGEVATFTLELGSIPAGGTAKARFWALALTYVTATPATSVLTDKIAVDGAEREITAADNKATLETQLLP